MDEEQALLVIQSALDLARNYYQMLLMDKLHGCRGYEDECGYGYLMLAKNCVFERIKAIEDEQNEGE